MVTSIDYPLVLRGKAHAEGRGGRFGVFPQVAHHMVPAVVLHGKITLFACKFKANKKTPGLKPPETGDGFTCKGRTVPVEPFFQVVRDHGRFSFDLLLVC